MKFIFILLLSLLLHTASAETCRKVLASVHVEVESLDFTDQTIAYLEKLVELQIVTNESLSQFAQNFTNPIPHTKLQSQILTRSENKAHYDAFEEILQNSELDKAKLLIWTQGKVKKSEQVKKEKAQSKEDTVSANDKMVFHRVRKGTFEFFNEQIKIKKDFEMMMTLVTQSMWTSLMGENPATNKASPNHPIETITWWSAAEFANRLSIKNGLQPVYDFSDIVFESNTKPENGTWARVSGKIKINKPRNSVKKIGYRLPKAEEFQYLYSKVDVDMDQTRYAWIQANSREETKDVALLEPTGFEGKFFYDLVGNVKKWVHYSFQTERDELWGYIIGASFESDPYPVAELDKSPVNINLKSSTIGFFLARDAD